jgi:hypothetical protein
VLLIKFSLCTVAAHCSYVCILTCTHSLPCRRAHEAEGGRELLDREDCIDNEADRVKHAQLMHRLNKLDLALLQVHSSVLLMEHF